MRCCQCKVWYCSPQCQEDHWPHHYYRCTPPPPLEWPNLLVVESSLDTPSLTELKMETKKKAEVEIFAQEKSIEEKLANEDSVLDISADNKKKTMKKAGVKTEDDVEQETAPEVCHDQEKMKRKEEKQCVSLASLYPPALSSEKISRQRIRVNHTEVLSAEAIISPTEFSINLAVEVRLRLELTFMFIF